MNKLRSTTVVVRQSKRYFCNHSLINKRAAIAFWVFTVCQRTLLGVSVLQGLRRQIKKSLYRICVKMCISNLCYNGNVRKPWRDIFTYYLSLITYYLLLITYYLLLTTYHLLLTTYYLSYHLSPI